MRYRVALANSLNISAVKVLASIGGPEPLQDLLRHAGLCTLTRSPETYGLGLTIGNAEVRLLELANAYATLARLGRYKPYRLILDPLPLAHPMGEGLGERAIADPSATYLIADILSDNDARTLAFGPESPLRFDFPVACKTGTSSDFRDNWAFGYTPEFTVGVWVGNFDGSPMQHVSGVSGAAPILHDIVEHLHQRYGTTWYPSPTNIAECWIHPITGKRLNQPAPNALKEKFLAPNLPPLESASDYLTSATSDAKLSPNNSRPKVLLPSEYRDWLASSDNWLGDRAVLASTPASPQILFPLPGTTLYLDPDLPHQGRILPLRAAGADNLQWHSDSLQLTTDAGRNMALLTEGHHRLTVSDPVTGSQAETWFEVLTR